MVGGAHSRGVHHACSAPCVGLSSTVPARTERGLCEHHSAPVGPAATALSTRSVVASLGKCTPASAVSSSNVSSELRPRMRDGQIASGRDWIYSQEIAWDES